MINFINWYIVPLVFTLLGTIILIFLAVKTGHSKGWMSFNFWVGLSFVAYRMVLELFITGIMSYRIPKIIQTILAILVIIIYLAAVLISFLGRDSY